MSAEAPTALIADDEPLLRESLERLLAQAWPSLRIVARARNGREAVDQFETLAPDVCFLDVHMPGMTGVEAARHIGRRAHLVFVTAFDQYAVQAFAQGVLDYLVKPVEPARLAETVRRLEERLQAARPATNTEDLLRRLAAELQKTPQPPPLRWLRASVGASLRLIAVDAIDYLRAEDKYTTVAWRDEAGQPREAVIRTPLKELLGQLDASRFVQVHRSVVVNLGAIAEVVRHENDTAEIVLRGRPESLPVSRTFLPRFRQM
ncbi:MAG TPA: LytTR family DNA-binding domain-containing protein [Steroidobacteraceae bacterium]|nr:LytTR family DNA-binding domain-containing protein [Steroidobacteraceae bacterium]